MENAFAAFFADESSNENNLESFRNVNDLWRTGNSSAVAPKISKLETILKQVFLFFPGTFVLYVLSMGFTVIFFSTFVKPSGMTPRFETGWMAMIFLAATLMTWLGLGDVRKLKHLVIPVSIMSVGLFLGTIVGFILLALPSYYVRQILGDSFLFYIFPLALVVPFLAKGWVDRKSD